MGTDLIVMIPDSSEVLKLTGESAEVVRAVRSGLPVVAGKVVDDLKAVGVLDSPSLTRRGLVRGGAIGVGAGIAVLAMPGVAAADSSRIKLVGEWYFSTVATTYYFNVYKEDNPAFPAFVSNDLLASRPEPRLTVGSETVPFVQWSDPVLWVSWIGPLASAPSVGAVVVGTFEHGGLRYEVRFSAIPEPV